MRNCADLSGLCGAEAPSTNATPDRFHVAARALISCSAADELSLYVYADGAAKTITPTEGTFVVHRVA